MNREIIFL